VILWDVDTQVDFMLPQGKLYVPGAEQTVPAMKRLVDAARAAGIVHVASADDHELTDGEISDQPDFQATYPPHCLRGTRGARKIPETEQEDPVPITLEPLAERYLDGREFLLLKKSFDVFTNPNTERLVEWLDPDEIVVFGVATDVCDDAAIQGFLQRGRRVRFVEDAARGLDERRVAACTIRWRQRGVEFTTVDEVIEDLKLGAEQRPRTSTPKAGA
jgi:nicotinamidase/pyrazinamidase